jgi:thermitase
MILGAMVSAIIVLSAWVLWDYADFGNPESTRLMSLGVPKEIMLDAKKELKVLLSDPAISKNWGLMGTGGASDIKASRAWEITQGSKDITVAIIDTGVDSYHNDLKANLWNNPGETGKDKNGKDKATNGKDDDDNGYVDDVHGWNFVSNVGDLKDNHGHGTHVAGIVGAEGGNGIGISGVSPHVSLMILKYYDPKARANDNLNNTVRAIRYAVQMGAKIINYSGGGTDFSKDEFAAVKEAQLRGVLFIAAAGNERSNSDISHYYPADYDLDNIISVTAINPNAEVLASSNYGQFSVHIAAPGEGIFSTLPDGKYGIMTGTSQATAFVSGVAALIMANNRNFDYLQVRQQILKTADEIPGLRNKNKTSGKLNSWAALAIQPSIAATGIVTKPETAVTAVFAASTDSSSTDGDSVNPLTTLSTIGNALKNFETPPTPN